MQIKYVCGEATSLPTIPSNLMETFTDSLEKLSVMKLEEGGVAVIIIDGADLIKVHEESYTCIQIFTQSIHDTVWKIVSVCQLIIMPLFLQDCEHSLYWLLQPLPNNIRVVLSANEENYPDSWRYTHVTCLRYVHVSTYMYVHIYEYNLLETDAGTGLCHLPVSRHPLLKRCRILWSLWQLAVRHSHWSR